MIQRLRRKNRTGLTPPQIVLALLLLGGCGAEADPSIETLPANSSTVPTNRLTTLEYEDSLGVDFEAMELSPTGLYLRDVVVGEGEEAATGTTVTVHYTGFLHDGSSFDSSRERNEPYEVMLGAGRVIRGWELGIPGMREGGRRTLVIPPDLGYGSPGSPAAGIPPNAVLVFDVELLQVN